ncbi:protein NSP-INTERACTING kinase [Sesamum alatum]|uniref:Protein NSP-INTERACTING kinase n=1 Tax=Sesamum alatum TaxID=300844 RepID=A0AAE1XT90_9LAMI|nr:protein NSP-INTERACTING kinase [Sesamum alatum]
MRDPHGVLDNWDGVAVDPCSWTMVTSSSEKLIIGLESPSLNLSGTLSPSIRKLTNLQIILLQNNNITGPVPAEHGRLSKLQTLDFQITSSLVTFVLLRPLEKSTVHEAKL